MDTVLCAMVNLVVKLISQFSECFGSFGDQEKTISPQLVLTHDWQPRS
jgi:hypothetical protein